MGEEEFIKKLGIFSDLKLRAGYGMAGNNRIGRGGLQIFIRNGGRHISRCVIFTVGILYGIQKFQRSVAANAVVSCQTASCA